MARNRRIADRWTSTAEDLATQKAENTVRRVAAFDRQVPEEYRTRTLADLPSAALRRGLAGWWNSDSPFLWLPGASWTGKTTTLWIFARKASETGLDWHLMAASDYLRARRGLEDRAVTDRAHNAGLLLLDEWPLNLNDRSDLDYVRDLLNSRRARGRRTVVTANGAPGLGESLLNHPSEATREAAHAVHNRLTELFVVFPYTHAPLKD